MLTFVLIFGLAWLLLVPLAFLTFERVQREHIYKLMTCKWTITNLPLSEQFVVQRTQFLFGC